jgi:SpoVK/Ycf46/Vps4 family AAA+-type ATPase
LIRRFAVQIKVGIPREKDRIAMLKRHLDGVDHTLTENDFKKLGSVLDGFSGSDLESLSRDAAMAPVRECIRGAVMMKRRRIGGSSRHGSEQGTVDETFRASQQHLLEELSSLRPVNFQDFVISLKFWASRTTSQVGVDTPNSPLAKLGIQVTNVEEHYNSSSDEDNERF